MKKVIVLISALAFTAAFALAQDPYQATPTNPDPQTATQPAPAKPTNPANFDKPYNNQQSNVIHQQKDGIVYRDGKVWNVKGGKSTAVDKEATLANGTKVKSDGTVVMKDGTQTTLSEGDYISMDGKLERAKLNRMGENKMEENKKDYKDQE